MIIVAVARILCRVSNLYGDYYAVCYIFLLYSILVVARGFPRCTPNRIPGKMPEDKMLENKMSENGKPDKMPDNNLTRTLTLTSP